MKDSSEFYDYRETRGPFKTTCRACVSKKQKKYRPMAKPRQMNCLICKKKFEYNGVRVICGDEACKSVMKRLYYYYDMTRKKDRWSEKLKKEA